MARPLRLEYEGAVYHITSRGNVRESIFLDNGDRVRFLEILADVVDSGTRGQTFVFRIYL